MGDFPNRFEIELLNTIEDLQVNRIIKACHKNEILLFYVFVAFLSLSILLIASKPATN